tara:strand:+ start:56 stop:1282 length:1227 start_codon:yes stop_codon:yes gene_type:complete
MSPLPDAKPDKRIYQLLKTTDLANLTFSDFQKVAETIFAEQGAEDELRRIVLINLARLSVAGEWSGLTSSSSGMTSFDITGDSGSAQTVTNSDTVTVAGGTGISTVASATDTVTVNLDDISPNPSGSFTRASITVDQQGRVTAASSGSTPTDTTYDLKAAASGSDAEIQLDASAGTDSAVKLAAGTNVTLTESGGDTITIAASGGGGTNAYDVQLPSAAINAGADATILHSRMPPWGSATSSANSLNSDANPKFWPFVCAKTGNLDKMVIDVSIDGTGVLGLAIYSDTGTCLPDSKIGGDFSLSFGSGTGCFDLTPSSTVALTRGTQYWIGVVETTTGNGSIRSETSSAGFSFGPISDSATSYASTSSSSVRCLELSGSSNTLPSSVTATNLTNKSAFGMPRWGAKFA